MCKFHLRPNLFHRRAFMDGNETAKSYQHGDHSTHNTAQEICFVAVLENFVRSADIVQQTVLFPSVLMDLTVNSVLPSVSPNEIYLNEETDLRTFCLLVKSLKIQLTEGCSYIEDGIEENIQMRKKVKELCEQLRPLIRQAKYLGYAAEEIALSLKPASFQEFTEHEMEHAFLYDDHSTCNLRATLETFLHEVDEMEEEILFPSLLKSYSAADYGCNSNEGQTLNDLYVTLLQVKGAFLDSQGIHLESVENSAFAQTVSQLKDVFYNYTIILDKLVAIYLQKVHEDC